MQQLSRQEDISKTKKLNNLSFSYLKTFTEQIPMNVKGNKIHLYKIVLYFLITDPFGTETKHYDIIKVLCKNYVKYVL